MEANYEGQAGRKPGKPRVQLEKVKTSSTLPHVQTVTSIARSLVLELALLAASRDRESTKAAAAAAAAIWWVETFTLRFEKAIAGIRKAVASRRDTLGSGIALVITEPGLSTGR
ncbi:hypothetical protein AXG93_903s1090 [Marchantia polymorpha subsp. ruderalis]|uniref:Uncharacterized protein n=1 Tax=Marchantia polymorpha subsp. ruderalis TaxID=1480154 RepID=A0A176VZA1_MARPO|nr:hypothetical protein AXG93_903s1090 [Marchantia polymorpha subsp. ruderalis]